MNQFSRTKRLIGSEQLAILAKKKVAIVGIGGVGGYVAEALARSGIGAFYLIDKDVVDETNINRQIIATYDTIGQSKTTVMKNRIASINPQAVVSCQEEFYLPETMPHFTFNDCDYIIDCVDTVTAKLSLIELAKNLDIPIISCMGTGNKLDPSRFEITDISKTSVCPLAKVIRRELRLRNIAHCKVLYSKEEPRKPYLTAADEGQTKIAPGSVAFVPSVAGLLIAAEVFRDLIGENSCC